MESQNASTTEESHPPVNLTLYSNVTDNDNITEYYYDYVYQYVQPYQVQIFAQWEVTVLGYVYFILGIATIIMNWLVFCVFLCRRIKTPTSVVLSVLAVSNSLICLSQIPSAMFLYVLQNYKEFVPYKWCVARHVLYIIHQISRSTSNWLTAALGIQRSIIVCYPFQAKRYCSMKNTCVSIVVIIIISVAVFINEAVAIKITPMMVMSLEGEIYDGCSRNFPQWYMNIVGDMKYSIIGNYVSVGVITRLLPCVVLSVTTIILTYKLTCKKDDLASQSMNAASSERRVRRVTILVFLIMIIFLAAELQDAIAFGIYVYEVAVDKWNSVLTHEEDKAWSTIGTIMWLLGYHFNSWIFFFMSSQFRTAFQDMYVPKRFVKSEKDPTTGVSLLKTTKSTATIDRKHIGIDGSTSRLSSSPDSRRFLPDFD
ncbi:hypothetical protein FSP39_022842 [Pinctada imbricata]|uniref:G-protein coupled receptors family 1 profile domain-containing protein n=1 Tax=Pinctada imbricata TaxID=66713 RepID=A0AA88XK02_PINIB|nr:hypothetical protein FSP39_022842 [Pinctada imbricata]